MVRGRTALVTGSTSGIGLAIARAFAAQGANIVINGFGAPRDIEEERRRIEHEFGVTAHHFGADMSKPAEIVEMIFEARRSSAQSTSSSTTPASARPDRGFPPEKWDTIISINLSAAFHAIRAVAPGMKKRGWGRIISTASAHALVASPCKSAYVAAKHGIAGLTKTAALEFAHSRITVNAVAPGYVWTPLVEAQIPGTMEARGLTREQVIHDVLLEGQPTKEFVTFEQVAALAVLLATDDAAAITGAILSMDGGWTAH